MRDRQAHPADGQGQRGASVEPGSSATSYRSTDQQRLASARAYCDLLYGDRSGYVYMFTGAGGYFTPNDSYKFICKTQFWWAWPDTRDEFLSLPLVDVANLDDVYVCPQLRRQRTATQDPTTTGCTLWCDVDGPWTAQRQAALDAFLQGRAAHIVDSGHGKHVYVPLDRMYLGEEIEHGNRILMKVLDGDSKWSENSLLRLPGAFNHKDGARGGTSTLVRWDQP